MSDESISHKEDRDDLLYIYGKFRTQQTSASSESDSSSSETSLPAQCLESDINLYNAMGKQVGPEAFNDSGLIAKTKPFDFCCSYGINTKTGVINLTAHNRTEIIFSSSNLPILYNYCTKQMKCLEGHQCSISSISSDESGRWLVSSGDQRNSYVIIWDSTIYKPIYTFFNIYPLSGTLLVKLSNSARYLITIGVRKEGSYSVDIWLWTFGNEDPDASYEVDKSYGVPVEVCFNPNIEEFIMVIFKKQVFLLVWDNQERKIAKTKIPQITHQNKIGILTTGTYLNNCHECYVCSNKGCVLIFGNTLYSKPYEEGELDNMRIFKNAVKVSDYALKSCATTSSLVVIGDASGSILFFDRTIKILYWFMKFSLAPIISISFSMTSKIKAEDLWAIYTAKTSDSNIFECGFTDITDDLQAVLKTNLPKDASLKNNPILVADFFIATLDGNVYAVDFLNKKCDPVFLTADDNVSAIDVHDELSYLIIGYANGRIHLVDYEKNEVICTTMLPRTDDCTAISSLKYSPESIHLVCGRETGEIWILEPIILNPKKDSPFRPTKNKVMKIVFSANKAQFAYYDTERTVVLFSFNPECAEWEFTGKVRSHYDDIHDIMFMPFHEKSILVTIGRDRHMVLYNNDAINNEEFGISLRERIEQRAIPMSFIRWGEKVKEKFIDYFLIADNEHKFKLVDPKTKIPKSVILAPAFGCFKNQIITKMMIIPNTESRYMIFLTHKFLGLHIMLPDGNPYKYVGYMGHPLKVVDFVLSADGKCLFTFGLEDHCVFKWKIKAKAADLMHLIGGKELEPFYCLIEGGKNGWLFQEIKDLFYYMQILQQETIDYPRRVSDSINVTELPELVRTCGFYPSEYELENMMIDIKYKFYHETGLLNTEISFIDFVKLFCNHKPVYGYSKDSIRKAFNTIVQNSDSINDAISREEFASTLTYSGEFINPSNLVKLLKTLLRSEETADNLEFLPDVSFTVVTWTCLWTIYFTLVQYRKFWGTLRGNVTYIVKPRTVYVKAVIFDSYRGKSLLKYSTKTFLGSIWDVLI